MGRSYRNTSLPVKDSLFALDFTIQELERFGDNPLIRLIKDDVDFEDHRPLIERAVASWRTKQKAKRLASSQKRSLGSLFKEDQLPKDDSPKQPIHLSRAGRPAFDPVLMFRVAFYCAFSRKSDRAVAQAILDSATLQKFLKIAPGTQISPQAIWDYRECFANSEVGEFIFSKHLQEMQDSGLVDEKEDMILDGSFVEAPRQRNTREENQAIKEGRGDGLWIDCPAKKRQKDVHARWTKKNDQTYYGYKMHALVGAVSKVILHVSTTAANVHDSRALAWMLNEEEDAGRTLFADSAYSGKNLEELTRSFNVNPCFCEKGYANTPLTELQQKLNHLKSKIRCRIEHVFGFIETVFKDSFVRSIGLKRAAFHSWLTALAYNVFRRQVLCRNTC